MPDGRFVAAQMHPVRVAAAPSGRGLRLFRWLQLACNPPRRVRLHRIVSYGNRENVLAFCALKCAELKALGVGHDTRQHHASLAIGAARSFNWKERGLQRNAGITHRYTLLT